MPGAIALFASSRRNGNTGRLVDAIAARLGMEVVDLSARRISGYDYEHRNRDDDFEPLMQRVLQFDRIVFASPVYWYAVSPPMKVFLDRITDLLEVPDLLDAGRRLRGKTAYVVCTSVYEEAPASFLAAWADTIGYLGMRHGGIAHVNCSEGFDAIRHDREAERFAGVLQSDAASAAPARDRAGAG